MRDNVIRADFGGSPFPRLGEMYEDVWQTIMQYEGQVPTLGVVGVLRLLEHRLLTEVHGDAD